MIIGPITLTNFWDSYVGRQYMPDAIVGAYRSSGSRVYQFQVEKIKGAVIA